MKREAMSALRERGLRSDVFRCAEPKSCESQLKQIKGKTGSMRTYLLRDPKAVQPQRPAWSLRTEPAGPATNDLRWRGGVELERRVRTPSSRRAEQRDDNFLDRFCQATCASEL